MLVISSMKKIIFFAMIVLVIVSLCTCSQQDLENARKELNKANGKKPISQKIDCPLGSRSFSL